VCWTRIFAHTFCPPVRIVRPITVFTKSSVKEDRQKGVWKIK
jgi:hypothetical protein